MKNTDEKRGGVFSKGIILLIVIMVVAYALLDGLLRYKSGFGFSDTMTTCWFAFWGVELVNLVLVRIGKLRHPRDTVGTSPSVGSGSSIGG